MGYLNLSAMAESGEQTMGLSQRLGFQSFLHAATSISASNPVLPVAQNLSIAGPFADFHRGLLRQGISLSNVETQLPLERFLDVSALRWPFLDRESLVADHQSVLKSHEQGTIAELVDREPEKAVLAYLAVATGILQSPHYRYRETFATNLALTALQLVPKVLAQCGNLSTVQCLTALAIYSLFSPLGGSTWHLTGLAMTRCISSGLHIVKPLDTPPLGSQRLAENRLFWTLYILDRYGGLTDQLYCWVNRVRSISTALDRPFCLQDEDITAPVSMPSRLISA